LTKPDKRRSEGTLAVGQPQRKTETHFRGPEKAARIIRFSVEI
jgi:hypothetical protein